MLTSVLIITVAIVIAVFINSKEIKIDGSTVSIPDGKNKISVQICANNIVRIQNLINGKEGVHTAVIGDNKWTPVPVTVDKTANPITIKTNKMIVKIDKNTHRISVYNAKGELLVKEEDTKDVYTDGVKLQHSTGDKFYGISGYDCNDSAADNILRKGEINVEAGEQGYCGGPFTWSTKGYGVLVDSDGGTFNLDDTNLDFSDSSRPDTEYYVFAGKPTDIMGAVAKVTGQSPMYPKWAMGFTNSQWGIDENQLINIVDTYREKNIPIDNYTLDFDWKAWGEDNYGEFRWNDTKFPDGKSGKLKQIMDQKGIKITGIMKPRIHVATVEGKYATKNKLWYPYSVPSVDYFSNKLVDNLNFALPATQKWFFDNCKKAIDTGIAGWWNDEADELHDNFQFMNMEKALYNGQRAYNNQRVWSINRNFYLGSQRYAYGMWSGDISTGFDSMANQRQRMLSAINLGEAKWGMDTGGFNGGDPTPQNYARWMEFSAFVPIFRVHGNENSLRQPWVFGTTAEAAATKAIRLRYSLIPYIYAYDREAYEGGVGIVKPLVFDYPDDPKVANYVNAWMFGDYFLVSPVVEEDATTENIYLPAGTWTDYFTGKVYKGGQTIDYAVNNNTWDDIPLFIKKGAIIPNQDYQNYVGEKPVTNLYVDIFPDTKETSFNYYDDDGSTYNYEKNVYFKQTISTQDKTSSAVVNISSRTGSYNPDTKYYILKVHGRGTSDVKLNNSSMKVYSSYNDLLNSDGEGIATGKDVYGDVTYIKVKTGNKDNIIF
jgi:alpha-glucosidase